MQSFKIVKFITSDYYGTTHSRTIDAVDIVCFAAGTQILTERGEVAIEDITIGDMVQTLDHGLQQVRWIGCKRLDSIDLAANPKLKPIRIAAGCLGGALPYRDLLVSPQHRILVRSKIAQRMFGTQEVLGAAKQFLRLEGFDIVQDAEEVTYHHMLFDQHEIIFAEGAPSESLFTGPVALDSVAAEARDEILAIMPGIAEAGREIEGARMLLSGRPARKLASRHLQNRKLLLADA
ncbi:hemolysin [Paracoccus zhejiangensis]|uniref:Hemolysin n=2 Tax=Paracoccus zhejiangensis TaxID=1077935 RepID=A0A2H5F403_9RHOB|nr:hemolysin [Paracoccus zhejiangensis]